MPDPHGRVGKWLRAAAGLGYARLRARHVRDHSRLYDRVDFRLGAAAPDLTTDRMVEAARTGAANPYFDELAFQYGRYLLIASSRKGALPPNLQGVWNVHQDAPWTAGYWHNVNQQMNYWPAFNTNLVELFDSYLDFYRAYLSAQRALATQYLTQYHPAALSPDGDNGWALGNSMRPFEPSAKVAHSGFGTGAWTTMLFWDAYDFSRDAALLRRTVYPAMRGQANFLSRLVRDVDGMLLAVPSSSPENAGNLQSPGTTFDQQMIFENYRDTIAAAGLLGIRDPLVATLRSQMPRLDPILIGDSGQIKEYREETTYGSIGDPRHRHISQLYPGQLINSTTRAWLDGARVTLDGRGMVGSKGWAQAERLATWARIGDGNKAYAFYRYWMSHHAMYNLWNNHNDSLTNQLFQIDANFGVTAGVGEMLLQSHEGVIEPLPALPRAWPTGSYRGLLTRGAFEVSATWSNGRAERFTVVARAGGPLKLRYPGIAGATVRTFGGGRVKVERVDDDTIAFGTAKHATYVVTAIPAVAHVDDVADVRVAAHSGDAVRIEWQPAGGMSYAVDRAIGNAPTYRRIGTGLSAPRHVDSDAAVAQERHIRYRVLSISPSGRESAGVPIFRLRPAKDDARALRIDDDLLAYDAKSGALPSTAIADGRYAVAMDWTGGNLTEIRLDAKSRGTARLRNPMFDRPVRVEANGRHVPAIVRDGMLAVDVKAGSSYRIVSQAANSATVSHGALFTGDPMEVAVTVKAHKTPLAASTVTPHLPAGWRADPPAARLAGIAPGKAATARFTVRPSPAVADGDHTLSATVQAADWSGLAAFAVTARIPNLALGRPATQSSLSVTGVPVSAAGGVAGRAIDGNTNGQVEAASVTGTLTEDQPWWQIDLGSVQAIGTIVIWNRTDSCCKAALSDYHVLVSDRPIGGKTLSQALAQPGTWSNHAVVAPAPSVRLTVHRGGRYVRVWSANRQELNLAEVQIFPRFADTGGITKR